MSIRTNHQQNLDWYATTLHEFLTVMEENNLRLVGKMLATVVIGGLALMGRAGGDVASMSIAAIWVVTIPSIIEAWIIAKNRQAERPSDS